MKIFEYVTLRSLFAKRYIYIKGARPVGLLQL